MKDNEFNFEQAFARLEEILNKMHSGNVTLDESIQLYEEADRLIVQCGGRLNAAQARIEQLIKNREGDLLLDANLAPQKEVFSIESDS